jgi:hypothetical protein
MEGSVTHFCAVVNSKIEFGGLDIVGGHVSHFSGFLFEESGFSLLYYYVLPFLKVQSGKHNIPDPLRNLLCKYIGSPQ